MKKYVCTGSCHGESDKPGVCGAETCEKHGQPLVEVEVSQGENAKMEDEQQDNG
jgi:hypothetical protein